MVPNYRQWGFTSQACSGYRWVFTEQTCAAAVLYLPQFLFPVPCMHVELCWRGDSKCGGSKQQFQESRIVFCVDVALSCSSRDAVGIRRWQDAAVSPLVSSLGFTMYKHFQRMRKLWTPFSCFLNMPLT